MISYSESAADYHRIPMRAIGSHALMDSDPECGGSLAKFHALHILNLKERETEAMRLGRAIHARILERREFTAGTDAEFVVQPETYTNSKGETKPWNNNAKECSAWVDTETRAVLKPNQVRDMDAMAKAVHAQPECAEMLSKGNAEVTIRHADPMTGLMKQCRFDWLRFEEMLFGDLKTTCENLSAFPREANYRFYDRQVAWYGRMLAEHLQIPFPNEAIQHRLIAVTKEVPWSVQIFRFRHERIVAADEKNQIALQRLAEAWSIAEWPDNTGGIITID
jgi:hypothetical protein